MPYQNSASQDRLAPMITPAELAAHLRISKDKAYDLLNSGEIPCVNVGGEGKAARKRIRYSDVETYLLSKRQEVA